MSHIDPLNIDPVKVAKAGPVKFGTTFTSIFYALTYFGVGMFGYALMVYPHNLLWGAFYSNVVFWMGLSVGAVMIAVIFQVVHAKWAPSVRRLAEANVSFFPFAWMLLMACYFGSHDLFTWGRAPMPGREWWMQPEFVFVRNGLLLGFLFILLTKFVRWSLRRDVGLAREVGGQSTDWHNDSYNRLVSGWKGSDVEGPAIEGKMVVMGPILIALYAIIYSLFAFEMVMGMDAVFFSNMFGGFMFVGNIYAGWAVLAIWIVFLKSKDANFNLMAGKQQLHDLGKLTFGFTVLWAYLFFSQFLPIWYGNMPEETQWFIVRTRDLPWKALTYTVFGMCFVSPFIIMLSRDVKRTGCTLAMVCSVILFGLFLERYILIMPQISASSIPFGIMEISFFLGFLGGYGLCIKYFMEKYPPVAMSDPAVEDSLAHAH